MELNKLSDCDAAYIAGLIDGEGTITLSRKYRDSNRILSVSISNTEIQLLEFTKSAIGAGKITNKKAAKKHHTPSYTYAITNRQALTLLEQITPYLKSYKKERARLILKEYVRLTPRNGKYTNQIKAERQVFENNVLSIKACSLS